MKAISEHDLTVYQGDVREQLAALEPGSVQCVVTSPPYYGLRDYGVDGQIGLEASPAEYVAELVGVFRDVRRVLADDGVCWLNLGDSYSGSWGNQGRKDERGTQRPVNAPMLQPVHDGRYPDAGTRTGAIRPGAPPAKNLLGIPWRVAFALQDDGWTLRNAAVWHKPNAMPESVTDRLSTRYEHVFLLSKSRRYHFDLDAIREGEPWQGGRTWDQRKALGEPMRYGTAGQAAVGTGGFVGNELGRNPGDVWTVATQPFSGTTRRTARPTPDHRAPGAAAYGKRRIASPDCPLHESADRLGSSASDDAHGEDLSSRTADSGDRLGLAQAAGSAPTQSPLAQSNARSSSDSQDQPNGPVANPRSSESHRTGLAPETSPACTPSVQTPTGTGHTEALFEWSEPQPSSAASSSGGRGSRAASARKNRSTARICTCAWADSTQEISHFATMPPELARRCILAGCPEGGTVLDPFAGSGTTLMVARKLGRQAVGVELNPDYIDIIRQRIGQAPLDFGEASA